MNPANPRKVRAVSARPANLRPQSSKNRKAHQKTEFIENVYASNASNPAPVFNSFQKNKLFSTRSNAIDTDHNELTKFVPKADKMTRDREELFEENLHLKKQINQLKEELMRSRTKIETLTSKNSKYTKQFNREFEKKMYWNGPNTYMISGVKAQYERLKAELDEKEIECSALKRELYETRAPQFKIYAQTLQEENKKLSERISKMAEISQDILFDNGSNTIPEWKYLDLKSTYQKTVEKLESKQLELRLSQEQTKNHQKKIEFLQKLIIEKDNSQYHAVKKAKKLQRQKTQQMDKITLLEQELQDISKGYEAKIEKLRQLEDKRFYVEKAMFEKALNEKQARIKKLQKEVAYLSTLLTYWKPLDEMNIDMMGGERNDHEDDPEQGIPRQNSGEHGLDNNSSLQNLQSMNASKKMRRASEFSQRGTQFIKPTTDPLSKPVQEKKIRVQQTADERHSEAAEKKRKVDAQEVEHIGQHLRYRFLGLRLSLEEVRRYFDRKAEVPNNPEAPTPTFILGDEHKEAKEAKDPSPSFLLGQDEKQTEWEDQYITMGEMNKILKQYPFQLTPQDANLLSRYMIEDSNKQYVYVDPNNQHKRRVVKSILKALVGDYVVLDGTKQQLVEKQCEDMMTKYQTNLLAALTTTASSGYVSRKKFLELVNSLGIELSDEGRDLLVCRMLLKSESLNKLSYMIIF